MNSALELIPAAHAMLEVDGGGHDLLSKKITDDLPSHIASEFLKFLKTSVSGH
jgi:hypothetical protein